MAATDTTPLTGELMPAERADAKPPAVITTSEAFRSAMARWEGRFNVLTPFSNVSGLAVQHGIIATQVRIDTNTSKQGPGEVYDGLPFLKGNEVALAKRGLRKLAECAGVSTRTERTDGRGILHLWEVKATATYLGIDGSRIYREATVEWDLRDGSPRLKGWTQSQIEEARKHGMRACETRAVNAVIRECGCGLKQAYTKQELARPFMVMRVAFQPDMSDPEQRRLVTEHSLRGTGALYPAAAAAPALGGGGELLEETDDAHDEAGDEPRSVGAKRHDAGAAAPADADRPPVEGAVRVEKVEAFTGKNGQTGRPWTKYTVVDSHGVACTTFDKSLADAAERFRQSRAWVEIATATEGDFTNLVEIAPAGQQPSLGLEEGDGF